MDRRRLFPGVQDLTLDLFHTRTKPQLVGNSIALTHAVAQAFSMLLCHNNIDVPYHDGDHRPLIRPSVKGFSSMPKDAEAGVGA